MVNALLAALLVCTTGVAAANEAHAPAAPAGHKAAATPAAPAEHKAAAPGEHKPAAAAHGEAAPAAPAEHAEAKATETLAPSIHPLRRPAIHKATPVHTASAAPSRPASKSMAHKPAASHAKATAHGAAAAHDDGHGHDSETGKVQNLVNAMLAANTNYMKRNNSSYFDKFASKQTPRATVVTCADSRVQSNAFHPDAVNDLFMVRNIGNQLATSEGSIEYGVRHLNTPLLMFIGHAVCGAVAAASGDFSKLERPIQKELLTINIPKGINVNEGVLMNVNNQVESAMLKFGGEVESGKLAVIGAFYDFRNDYKQGKGKLIITNINGETDPAKLAALTKAGNFFNAATGMNAAPAGGH
jgi:carbonic anhydrase